MSLEVIHGQLTKSNHISIYTNDKQLKTEFKNII